MNPTFYLFDHDEVAKTGKLEVKYSLPYSDLRSLSAKALDQVTHKRAYEFGHTLEDQIGGQIGPLQREGVIGVGNDDQRTVRNVGPQRFLQRARREKIVLAGEDHGRRADRR